MLKEKQHALPPFFRPAKISNISPSGMKSGSRPESNIPFRQIQSIGSKPERMARLLLSFHQRAQTNTMFLQIQEFSEWEMLSFAFFFTAEYGRCRRQNKAEGIFIFRDFIMNRWMHFPSEKNRSSFRVFPVTRPSRANFGAASPYIRVPLPERAFLRYQRFRNTLR